MRRLRVVGIALSLSAIWPAQVFAQPKDSKEQKEKSPADQAYDAFMALRNDKEAKINQARLQKMSKAAVDFLAENPKHRQANNVIAKAFDFAGTIADKGMRRAYFAQVQLDVINKGFDDKVTEDGKAALAALDAATYEGEARGNVGLLQEENKKKMPDPAVKRQVGETMATWRSKIDALAEMPGGGRFLKDREASFVEFLKAVNPGAVEAFLTKLSHSTEKSVAGWAGDELNFIAARKQPFEFKSASLDGKEIDLAQLRGKVVYLVFFSTTSKGFADELEALKNAYADYGRKNFEIVSVCYDKEADREKVAAFVAANKIKWPVAFDGSGDASEAGKKLNVTGRGLPAGFLFDAKGILAKPNVRMKSVSGEVGGLMGAK